ncbi:MAG: DUF1080 domain-containing protein [Planctomycetota bacterium]|nr:DUF1080 domain-containing protein [Planctomycetota bacterium]
MRHLALVSLCLLSFTGNGSPFVDKYLLKAERLSQAGNLDAAILAVEKALERDHQHLGALEVWANLSEKSGDLDATVYALHQWLQIVDAAKKSPVPRKKVKSVEFRLLLLDTQAKAYRRLSTTYSKELHKLGGEHRKRGRFHSALEVFQEILTGNPLDSKAIAALKEIRKEGGSDVAVEDIYAGGDPLQGVDAEWLVTENEKHLDWENAWEKDGENYSYKTNGGYLILQTASIAMEQMNAAYRRFFHYKEDGEPTPRVAVLIYRTRDEYLKANGLPENDWTGGFFNGSTVQTFLGGNSGKESVRGMYGTLFHEAAHQFVSLTGKGGVPGWLNEAYASFFEGTTILSNGQVRWNRVASHRLMPLANRMDQGWMDGPSDGVRDEQGEWATPTAAPSLRILVENQYRWGPPWYAPTWGVVYFLYNYRTDDGQLVYRDALHRYYLSGAASKGKDGRAPWFEEIVLRGAPLSPVQSIDDLSEIWKTWTLELRDIELGRAAPRKSQLDFAKLALARKDIEGAWEFFEEALLHEPADPDVLWNFACFLEEQKKLDRAAALYRSFTREVSLRGFSDGDTRFETAEEKMVSLDPLHRRHAKLKRNFLEEGLLLAQSYRERALPLMALEIARKMSAQYSMPEAIDFYTTVSIESGKSLAQWKVAYNEYNLEGWAGSEDYRAYGKMIEAAILTDATIDTPEGTFQTKELACEVTFNADFTLEAEMKFGPNPSLMGLCFGRKGPNTTHAVVLHPAGFLDISTKEGGLWTYHDHRTVAMPGDWQKLRIDVVNQSVDVYLNDKFLRSLRMPSRESVRGSFGLITGTGTSFYRNIRILSRDPHDPAARVEREISLQKIAEDPSLREPGNFSGFTPPELENLQWIQGDSQNWKQLKGKAAVLVFWSANQEAIIPTANYYQKLASTYQRLGVPIILLIGGEHTKAQVTQLLLDHPMPDAHIAWDPSFKNFKNYNMVPGGWGMPRLLLKDVDGKVVWEGDPGLKPGTGWTQGSGDTYFDGPLKNLIQTRALDKIAEYRPRLKIAEKYHRAGLSLEALQALAPLADISADFSPVVRAAKDLRDQIEADGVSQLQNAEFAKESGYPITAAATYQHLISAYAGSTVGDLAQMHWDRYRKDKFYRSTLRAWKILERIPSTARKNPSVDALSDLLEAASDASLALQVTNAVKAFRKVLKEHASADALQKTWEGLQPEI